MTTLEIHKLRTSMTSGRCLEQACQTQTAVRAAKSISLVKILLAGCRWKNIQYYSLIYTWFLRDCKILLNFYLFLILFNQKNYCILVINYALCKSKNISVGRQRQAMGPHAARGPPV